MDTSKIPQLDRIEIMLQLALKHMLMPKEQSRLSTLSNSENEVLSALIHSEFYGT
jgi:hypothetical protein